MAVGLMVEAMLRHSIAAQDQRNNAQPIKSFEFWLPRNADLRMLWSSTLRLDQDFFASLRQHALPVDIRVLKAFSPSAKQIDMVMWLGYRLRRVDRRYPTLAGLAE